MRPLFCHYSSAGDVTVKSLDLVTRGALSAVVRSLFFFHSLVQVADDIFEDLVILLGKAA